jgi:transcriptional regulator with XRE-family HTH domain
MDIKITNTKQLGEVVRAVRKAHKLRADDVASFARLGPVFVRDVEYGKETIEFGRMLRLLHELGIKLVAEMPDEAAHELKKILANGGLVRPSLRKNAIEADKS